MKNKLNATFVSEWEWGDPEDVVETGAVVDLNSGVLEIDSVDVNVDGLIREYLLFDGEKYQVDKEHLEKTNEYRLDEESLKKLQTTLGNK